MLFHSKAVFRSARENTTLLVKYLTIFQSDSCNKYYILYVLCLWTKKYLNRTLAIDSPYLTFAVGLLVECID